MKKIWQLFVGDLKRLRSNVVTGIIVLGLIALPSIFSWYNMIAAWDVFGNTGNLKIAVASVDEGYESDLVPVKINVGEQVISALRANNQIKWVFTDKEDAIDGAKSGKYYAAVVIPESFSRDMMTFYSDDAKHAKIIYYSNEKKNAISPKVTDQGADAISVQVNQAFAKTLSDTALSLAQGLVTYADNADVDGHIGELANHVGSLSTQMAKASSVLRTYSTVLTSSQDLITSSASLLSSAKGSAEEVAGQVGDAKASATTIADAMDASTDSLASAIDASVASFDGVSAAVDDAFATAHDGRETVSQSLITNADGLADQAANYAQLADSLDALAKGMPDGSSVELTQMASTLRAVSTTMERLSRQLGTTAGDLEYGISGAEVARNDIDAQIAEAKQQVLDDAAGALTGSAGAVSEKLGDAKSKLDSSADELDESAKKLDDLSTNMKDALANGDTELLREVLGSDASELATAISAPVELDRHALFHVENFGSAMSPLYTTLALWIGALLIMVTIRPTPSRRIEEELGGISLPQQFLGRFGIVSLLSFAQSTVLAIGNMLFLGVQVENPLLYLLVYWIGGQVFAFIIYTLVVSFANLGKAIAVILLIVQVAGGGGAYPLVILPQFFQDVSVWLPATHVINAMRAAMFGVYQGDFWVEIGCVLLYVVPFALLGLVLRNPTMKLVNWFVEQVEKSKVV